MVTESQLTACFIGEQSLLPLCADEFLSRGHVIRAVATENEEVRNWAAGRSLPVMPSRGDHLFEFLSANPCDYLFSVINYRVLPEKVLRLPLRAAINYHDGPLPAYAGMYVTTWALINRERRHAVSWHLMAKEIDSGGVLREMPVDVAVDETAFTLNTKCFDAAFQGFRELLVELEQGTSTPRVQDSHARKGYYGLRKRPERMALLDWSRPAAELDAFFRALDFARYENPIGCPKVKWGESVLVPGRLTVLDQGATRSAGHWDAFADHDVVRVHTSTKIVELGSFRTLDGRAVAVSSLISPTANGASAPTLTWDAPPELDQLLERICTHESWWAGRLAGRDPVPLPYVPPEVPRDRVPGERIHHEIDCRQLLAQRESSLFATWAVAAVSLYAGRLSGKATFDLDCQAGALRGLPAEAARYFATSVPVRIGLNWSGSFAEHVQQVDAALRETEKRKTYACDLVLRYPQITEEHRQRLREVPDVAVAFHAGAGDAALSLPEAQLVFAISDSEPKITLVANHDVIGQELLAKIGAEFEHLLKQTTADPSGALADFEVVAPSEQAVLKRFNDETRIEYVPTSVPRLFEAQVQKTPEATALIFRGVELSYRELDDRANRLANVLVARGVKPRDLVGILVDRSVEMVVSMFAVLKSGAAYVPLDPNYPSHRLSIMVEDAGARFILTQESRVAQVEAMQAEAVVVDRRATFEGAGAGVGAGAASAPPAVDIDPHDVAYVMYTSGSTGRPKGAMVTHRNIQNFFLKTDRQLAGESLTWLAVTSISFDLSIQELFYTLTRGGKVILRGSGKSGSSASSAKIPQRRIDFSLVVSDEAQAAGCDGRRSSSLAADVVRFADAHEFAVWSTKRQAGATRDSTAPAEVVVLRSESTPSKSEAPLWIAAATHAEAFRRAAREGKSILTPLWGQSVDTLAKNAALYRRTWKESGHDGTGRIGVVVPTLVGDDEASIKETVRGPLTAFLKSDPSLLREAAWEFPPFQTASEDGAKTLDDYFAAISDQEMSALVEFAFERSFATSTLMGCRSHGLGIVDRLREAGVDEVACLIDFGLPAEQVLERLPELNALRRAANPGPADDPDDMANLIERHGVTHLQCTPSMAASLTWDPRTRRALGKLRHISAGGETMAEELARQLRSLVPGHVYNVYGPTETTVWSTTHEVKEVSGPVPIGAPIANTQLYVVDERRRPLPIGVPGELLIGGDGVGRGYLNRPDLTEARFLETPQGRVYRTGDLVRLRRDGEVEFLGRFDHQVKIRGHRIELGEIESVLELAPSVRKAVVHPQDDASGGKRLIAYVIVRSGKQFSADDLRQFVSERLPEFMVPSLFEQMTDFPMTPSGKVDRGALPKPSSPSRTCRTGGSRERTEPRTQTERQLVELWKKLLEVREVDPSDNFFDLGGHSLLGMRAIGEIHESFGVQLSTKTFLMTTLAQIASEIDRFGAARRKPALGGESGPRPGGVGKWRRLAGWFTKKSKDADRTARPARASANEKR